MTTTPLAPVSPGPDPVRAAATARRPTPALLAQVKENGLLRRRTHRSHSRPKRTSQPILQQSQASSAAVRHD